MVDREGSIDASHHGSGRLERASQVPPALHPPSSLVPATLPLPTPPSLSIRHNQAAREQKLLAQSLVYNEQAALVREAATMQAEAAAAAAAARTQVDQLQVQMEAAHTEAATAHAQLEDAGGPGRRQEVQAAWHAAALRWYALRDQHTAARTALNRAEGKERHARTSKLAALRLEEPPLATIADAVLPLPPRPPMPSRRPPEDLADFQRQQERLGQFGDPGLQWGQMDSCRVEGEYKVQLVVWTLYWACDPVCRELPMPSSCHTLPPHTLPYRIPLSTGSTTCWPTASFVPRLLMVRAMPTSWTP